jgi:hypothetical protein
MTDEQRIEEETYEPLEEGEEETEIEEELEEEPEAELSEEEAKAELDRIRNYHTHLKYQYPNLKDTLYAPEDCQGMTLEQYAELHEDAVQEAESERATEREKAEIHADAIARRLGGQSPEEVALAEVSKEPGDFEAFSKRAEIASQADECRERARLAEERGDQGEAAKWKGRADYFARDLEKQPSLKVEEKRQQEMADYAELQFLENPGSPEADRAWSSFHHPNGAMVDHAWARTERLKSSAYLRDANVPTSEHYMQISLPEGWTTRDVAREARSHNIELEDWLLMKGWVTLESKPEPSKVYEARKSELASMPYEQYKRARQQQKEKALKRARGEKVS